MSKEMLVIALGVWSAVVTQLGIPGSWKMGLLFLTGIAVAALGFLLRGEAIGRRPAHTIDSRGRSSFVDSPNAPKDGINSLN